MLIAAATESSARGAEERATYGKEVVPGSCKAGVFWHTQGSGKRISMCCYAGKLLQQPEMNNPTLVVVTDRNDLDGQPLPAILRGEGSPQADARAGEPGAASRDAGRSAIGRYHFHDHPEVFPAGR
jgi:SWI2/SNF2 ATPase